MRIGRGGRWAAVSVLLSLAACEKPPMPLQLQLDVAPEGAVIDLPEGEQPDVVVRRVVTLVGRGQATRLGNLALGQAAAKVRLESLSLSRGLDVPEGASVTLVQVRVGCEKPSESALRVRGHLAAHHVETAPGCGRGLDVQGGEVAFDGGRLAGGRAGARVVEGGLTAVDTAFESTEADGSALFAARSRLKLERVSLSGGAQGLLMRGGSLTGRALRVDGSTQAGLAFVDVRANLSRVHLAGPFQVAALQVSESPSVQVEALSIEHAGAAGVLALRSQLELSELEVAGTTRDAAGDFGHAVTLQDARATLRGLNVSDLAGAAVYASDSTAQIRGLHARGVRTALVALRSEVQVHGLWADALSTSAVYAADGARVSMRQVEVPASVGLAACENATVTNARGASLCPP